MDLVQELKDLLKKKKYTIAGVAKSINISNATLHLWLKGTYNGNVDKIAEAIKNFIEIDKLREGRIKIGFVKTTIVDDVFNSFSDKLTEEGLIFDKDLFLSILEFKKNPRCIKTNELLHVIQRLIDSTDY